MFNSLHSFGLVEDRRCIDLYAGSGALGLEALSRGAAHCTFVERDRRAARVISTNLENLDFADVATVHAADAARVLGQGIDAEVAFLDPPYEFDDWPDLLAQLREHGVEVVVIESDRVIDPGPAWDVLKEKAYAGTVVVIAEAAVNQTEAS